MSTIFTSTFDMVHLYRLLDESGEESCLLIFSSAATSTSTNHTVGDLKKTLGCEKEFPASLLMLRTLPNEEEKENTGEDGHHDGRELVGVASSSSSDVADTTGDLDEHEQVLTDDAVVLNSFLAFEDHTLVLSELEKGAAAGPPDDADLSYMVQQAILQMFYKHMPGGVVDGEALPPKEDAIGGAGEDDAFSPAPRVKQPADPNARDKDSLTGSKTSSIRFRVYSPLRLAILSPEKFKGSQQPLHDIERLGPVGCEEYVALCYYRDHVQFSPAFFNLCALRYLRDLAIALVRHPKTDPRLLTFSLDDGFAPDQVDEILSTLDEEFYFNTLRNYCRDFVTSPLGAAYLSGSDELLLELLGKKKWPSNKSQQMTAPLLAGGEHDWSPPVQALPLIGTTGGTSTARNAGFTSTRINAKLLLVDDPGTLDQSELEQQEQSRSYGQQSPAFPPSPINTATPTSPIPGTPAFPKQPRGISREISAFSTEAISRLVSAEADQMNQIEERRKLSSLVESQIVPRLVECLYYDVQLEAGDGEGEGSNVEDFIDEHAEEERANDAEGDAQAVVAERQNSDNSASSIEEVSCLLESSTVADALRSVAIPFVILETKVPRGSFYESAGAKGIASTKGLSSWWKNALENTLCLDNNMRQGRSRSFIGSTEQVTPVKMNRSLSSRPAADEQAEQQLSSPSSLRGPLTELVTFLELQGHEIVDRKFDEMGEAIAEFLDVDGVGRSSSRLSRHRSSRSTRQEQHLCRNSTSARGYAHNRGRNRRRNDQEHAGSSSSRRRSNSSNCSGAPAQSASAALSRNSSTVNGSRATSRILPCVVDLENYRGPGQACPQHFTNDANVTDEVATALCGLLGYVADTAGGHHPQAGNNPTRTRIRVEKVEIVGKSLNPPTSPASNTSPLINGSIGWRTRSGAQSSRPRSPAPQSRVGHHEADNEEDLYLVPTDLLNGRETLAERSSQSITNANQLRFPTEQESLNCSLLDLAMTEERVNVVLGILSRPDLNSRLITPLLYEKAFRQCLERGFAIQGRSSFSSNPTARRENADGLDARSDTRVSTSAVLNLRPPRGFNLWLRICRLFQQKKIQDEWVAEEVVEEPNRSSGGNTRNIRRRTALVVSIATSSSCSSSSSGPTSKLEKATTSRTTTTSSQEERYFRRGKRFEVVSANAQSRSVAQYTDDVLDAVEGYMGIRIFPRETSSGTSASSASLQSQRDHELVFDTKSLRCLKAEYWRWKRTERPMHVLGANCCGVGWASVTCEKRGCWIEISRSEYLKYVSSVEVVLEKDLLV
ncbi:unnamed protein product [Amoebophrya sp. A25]|nr:unnamed protein product [Amoebophrya sp. A25]|eukprot:GSA25T00014671001.1